MGKFKCQALVLLVPANFQAPRPPRVTLFPALSGSRIFCSCRAGVWLERQARVRLLSGWTFSYGNTSQNSPRFKLRFCSYPTDPERFSLTGFILRSVFVPTAIRYIVCFIL